VLFAGCRLLLQLLCSTIIGLAVAVKTLKDNGDMQEKMRQLLLNEGAVMIAIPYHRNIVTMMGMTLKPMALVVEFVDGPGDLRG
jgi:hypothetical protein